MALSLLLLTTQAVSLTLLDQQGAAVNLTGATEVRFRASGPTVIGPVVCTVTTAASGIVSVPLTPALLAVAGQYDYEVEARWGSTRVTGTGTLRLQVEALPQTIVMQGDSPTIQIQVPGTSLGAATLAFRWSAAPAAGDSAINGTVTGSGDTATVTLSATDTATAGTYYGRLTVNGVSTGLVQVTVQAQGLA